MASMNLMCCTSIFCNYFRAGYFTNKYCKRSQETSGKKKKKEKGFYTTSTKWPDMGIISAPKSFMEALGLIKKLSEHLSLHITKYNGLTSLKSNMHVFIIWMN